MFFTNEYDIEEYGNLPSEIAMIVQMVSIFYIIFFYRIHSKELLYGIHTFFVDGYRIMLEKIGAMFAAHFLFQGVMLAVTYSLYTVIYFIVGVELSSIYLSLIRFLFIYLFAPMLLCMLYGVIIAILFGTRKSSFLAILVVWIMTGGMNAELFSSLFLTIHANDWKSLLFIGLNTVQVVYQSYTGFDVHWGNELKLMTWFLIATGIILLLSLRWTLRRRERNGTMIILLVIMFLSVATSCGVVELSTKTFNRADYLTETAYYENLAETEADIHYAIQSYWIELKKKQATVQITFSEMDTLEPAFQLYHAYPLKWIKADDEQVNFTRNGDLVKVQLPTSTSSLTFHYEITDTSFVPYTNGRTALLADTAWYPKKITSHMYELNESIKEIELSEGFLPDESYSFTLKADEVLFSNLPRRGDVYSGEAQAVTLIKGQGNELTSGDYQITYPADWPHMKRRVRTVLVLLEKTLEEIQQFAPTTVQTLPKAIVFSNSRLSSFMTKDHLVYNTGYPDAVDAHATTKDFQKNMLYFVVQRKGPHWLYEEWVNMASDYIREKNEWQIDMKGISSNLHYFSESEHEQVDVIYQRFHQLSEERQRQFLQDWYAAMDDTWTWDQVLKFVEEERGNGDSGSRIDKNH